MLDVHTAARRIMARCDELAAYTSMTDGIERVYLSPEHARVNRLAARWMREVGLDTWQDARMLGGEVDALDAVGHRRVGRELVAARHDAPGSGVDVEHQASA